MDMQRRSQRLCIIFSLLILLCACGQSEKESRTATPSPSPTAPTEATQTCPTAGKARAAVLPAMPTSGQENLIYASQSTTTDDTTTLQRYNVATGKTRTLVKGKITQRAISPDGQWMALTVVLQGQWAIQLIRMDGQQLQTLYCASYFTALHFSPDQHSLAFVQTGPYDPSAKTFGPVPGKLDILDLASGKLGVFYSGPDLADLLFSPDAHSLAFTEAANPNSASNALIIDILDLTTGKVHAVMSDHQPGFPMSNHQGQASTSQSSTRLLSSSLKWRAERPLSGKAWNSLYPLQWARNGSLFVSLGWLATPSSTRRLYLLHNTGKEASQQRGNLQYIAASDDQQDPCERFSVTSDNQYLVCNRYDPFAGYPGEQPTAATITVRPITGGTFHTIYRDPQGDVYLEALHDSTLFMTHSNTVWKINLNGSGLTRLMTIPSNASIDLVPIASHAQYALMLTHRNNDENDVLIGSLNGGTPETIVKTTNETLDVIGWAS